MSKREPCLLFIGDWDFWKIIGWRGGGGGGGGGGVGGGGGGEVSRFFSKNGRVEGA